MNPAQIAVVGAGPAGCYTALACSKAFPEARIIVLDQLPVPYGLVRYGVAADHQGTKGVVAQFDRMFRSGRAHFLGGVRVGRDVSVERLLDAFDAVIWAGGLARDRRLGIPGEDLPGVYGSGAVSRAWNGHPLQDWRPIRIGCRVAVVGAGNVSLDLVRLLAKPPAQLAGSDLDDVFTTIVPEPVTELTVVVRGEPAQARWDAAMLHELGSVDGAGYDVDAGSVSSLTRAAAGGHDASAALAALPVRSGNERVSVRFVFGVSPVAVKGDTAVTGLGVERRGVRATIPVDTVVTAIGFEEEDHPRHPRLFRAGWARTGPRGTIPGLRSAARELVTELTSVLRDTSERPGISALPELAARAVTFEDWTRVDAHEVASAPPDRCRRKVRDLALLSQLVEKEVTRT